MTTVTISRAERGPHGDLLPAVTHAIDDCIIAPRSSSEDIEGGETVTVGYTLIAPFDADIRSDDRVMLPPPWAGQFDVVGEVAPWVSPFSGWKPAKVVTLTRTG